MTGLLKQATPRSPVAGMAVIVATLLLGACAVGPDYKRPAVELPDGWRVAAVDPAETANTAWWESFGAPALNALIRSALAENKDLRMATFRVEEFRARAGMAASSFYPELGYSGAVTREQLSENIDTRPLANGATRTGTTHQVGATVEWELDLWGKLRRADEAARADLLSAEEYRQAVVMSLVAEVANGYVQLLGLDRELEVAQATLRSREEWLRLFESRFKGGAISALELAQARSIYEEAAAAIPAIERRIALTENALSVLVGKNPGSIAREHGLDALVLFPAPQGLPSDLLARRPDVRQAEQELVAANARIGVAKAMYFPSISLTGILGYASSDLARLFDEPSAFGNGGLALAGPIFTAGRISGQVGAQEAIQKQLAVNYQRTVQNAFREVNDALVSRQKSDEQLVAEERKVAAMNDYVSLARKRYEGGYSSYIEVLDAERRLYDAQVARARAKCDTYASLVAIYKAMGGGWTVGGALTPTAVAETESTNAGPGQTGGPTRD